MKLLIIGATGRTGRHVVQQALARGHDVTAMIRRPGAIEAHAGLRLVVSDPLNAADLAPILAGQDVVISCLGQRGRDDAHLLQKAAAATLQGMPRNNRYIVLSQALLFPSRSPIVALLRLLLARHVADSTEMENLVRASDVDWTIVRPPRLREGVASRGYRVAVDALPAGPMAMQRSGLAACLIDEAEGATHKRSIVGVTSA